MKIEGIGPGSLVCLPAASGEACWIPAAEKSLCPALCEKENGFIKIAGLEWHFLSGGVWVLLRVTAAVNDGLLLPGAPWNS